MPSKPTFVPLKEKISVPEPDGSARFSGPGHVFAFVAGGRTFAEISGAKGESRRWLAWIDEADQVQQVEMPAYRARAVRPDGNRAVFVSDRAIFEVVLPVASAVKLFESDGPPPCGVAYGPPDTVLVLTMNGLSLHRRDGTELARLELEGATLAVFRDGHLALCRTLAPKVAVVAVEPSGLQRLGEIGTKVSWIFADGERIIATDYKKYYELRGV